MDKIVVTGGAGFAGSHVLERLVSEYPSAEFVVLDKMTYAAHYENVLEILNSHRAELAVGDICDLEFCHHWLNGADFVAHLAAESHVDRSFNNSRQFTLSNTLGTHTLLEACRLNNVPNIIHVSTDEVYGEAEDTEFDENTVLNPSNPYSASKAAAEMIIKGYVQSFDLPIKTIRANNFFGIRQFPEKIVPRFILNLLRGDPLPLHGDGSHIRNFLAVEDFAEAVCTVLKKGTAQEVYNVSGTAEFTNLQVTEMICAAFGVNSQQYIKWSPDRPFNDRRYAVSAKKINELGWRPQLNLTQELPKIIEWYRGNIERYAHFT
jgi:dTDP-glucose 4,6-dehydratase